MPLVYVRQSRTRNHSSAWWLIESDHIGVSVHLLRLLDIDGLLHILDWLGIAVLGKAYLLRWHVLYGILRLKRLLEGVLLLLLKVLGCILRVLMLVLGLVLLILIRLCM